MRKIKNTASVISGGYIFKKRDFRLFTRPSKLQINIKEHYELQEILFILLPSRFIVP
jgi:hypothetical protein